MKDVKVANGAWVFVGDGEKALLMRNAGDEVHPNLVVERLFEHDNPPTREQGTDRPGRHKDAPGPATSQRSAFEEVDWHRLEKSRFAREVADSLYRLAHKGRFDRLLVVAPPHTLGDLRSSLHDEVKQRIVGEINKSLTHCPVWEIERMLARR